MPLTLHLILYPQSSANLIIESLANQPSTRDPKPADWESWTRERQKEWWAPRNAARKARKIAARQKQQEHEWFVEKAMKLAQNAKVAKEMAEEAAEKVKKLDEQEAAEKAAAEKTVSSERTQGMISLPIGSHSQNAQFLPAQQNQQGRPSGYTQSGRGELQGAAYQTLQIPPNPFPGRPMSSVSPTYMQAFPSPYGTPQHKQDHKSSLGNTHALPARPATPSPKITASASPAVRSQYRKIEKKIETFEQTVERVRGEESKKFEEGRKKLEEEREELEWQKNKMVEEWKKIGGERKKLEKERKKFEEERMVEEKEEM